MKKKLFIFILLGIFLLGVTGCGEKKEEPKKEVDIEQLIWEDAKKDEIYDLKLFLKEPFSSMAGKGYGTLLSNRIDEIENLSKSNKFAEEILNKYNESSIGTIFNNSNDLETTILYSYLSIMTGRYEGIGMYKNDNFDKVYSNSFISIDDKKPTESLVIPSLDSYNLEQIYYSGFGLDGNALISDNYSKSYSPKILFVFSNNNDKETATAKNYTYVIADVDYDKNYKENNTYYSSLKFDYYIGKAKILEHYWDYMKKQGVSNEDIEALLMTDQFSELINSPLTDGMIKELFFNNENCMVLDENKFSLIINDNKDFFNIYLKYKNDIFYPRRDKERSEKKPQIGMTSYEVYTSTTWGIPTKKNTYNFNGDTSQEVWIYEDKGNISFKNGVVTNIS